MQLTIDIGNTRSKYVLWENGKFSESGTGTEFEQILQNRLNEISAIAWCTTAGEIPDVFSKSVPNCLRLTKFPEQIRNEYTTSGTLGSDRIAAVLGAAKNYPGQDVLVIDAGTCITTDFVTKEGVYLGGSISPGVKMRFRALNEFTARLPLIDAGHEAQPPLLGTSTSLSIQSGVWHGISGELNHRIHKLLKDHPSLTVLITGGDAPVLADYVNYRIFAAPLLVHYGLLYFLEINAI